MRYVLIYIIVMILCCHIIIVSRKQEDFNKRGGVKGDAAESAIARLIDSAYMPGDAFPGSVKH